MRIQLESLKAGSPVARRIIVIMMMSTTTLLLVHCQSITTHALNFPSLLGGLQRHAEISYAPGERALLDVYSPSDVKDRPVVVFWHGGLWVEGSRLDYRFVGAALARAGYVAVLPDYRLYPAVSFPAFVEDGASAVRWVHDHIAEYGGDPGAIFLMGHSAGAQIASLIALDRRYLDAQGGSPQWIRGFIGMSGPYALETGPSPTSVGICAARTACKGLLAAIFRAPYSARDWQPMPSDDLVAPPTLLLHGSQDVLVSVRHSEILRDRLLAQCGQVELYVYPDADHTDTILAFSFLSAMGPPAMEHVQHFIERQLGEKHPVSAVTPGTTQPPRDTGAFAESEGDVILTSPSPLEAISDHQLHPANLSSKIGEICEQRSRSCLTMRECASKMNNAILR